MTTSSFATTCSARGQDERENGPHRARWNAPTGPTPLFVLLGVLLAEKPCALLGRFGQALQPSPVERLPAAPADR